MIPHRDERGATLIEVVLTAAIAALLMAPLMGWIVLAFRAGPEARHRAEWAAQTSLTRRYLAGDIASAASVQRGGGGPTCGPDDGAVQVLVLTSGPLMPGRTVTYSFVGQSGEATLVRRECSAGPVATGKPLVRGLVEPAAGWTSSVMCRSDAVSDAGSCPELEFELLSVHGPATSIAGVRRIGPPR